MHLFFLSTAIFLRNPKDTQSLVQKIFCHIAEVCVLGGCIISIFALLAKEIYLQGFNSYVQNLVKKYKRKILYFLKNILLSCFVFRKATQKNYFINAHVF